MTDNDKPTAPKSTAPKSTATSTSSQKPQQTAPAAGRERAESGEVITDGASTTDHFTGEEIANGAADALHGERARAEKYEQGDASQLLGGTLIGDEPASEENEIGKRIDRDEDGDSATASQR